MISLQIRQRAGAVSEALAWHVGFLQHLHQQIVHRRFRRVSDVAVSFEIPLAGNDGDGQIVVGVDVQGATCA